MRQRDLHILTSALHTYTNDWRISAVHVTVRQPPAVIPLTTKDEFSALPSSSMVTNSNAGVRSSGSRNINATSGDSVWDDEEGVWSEWTLVS